MGDSGAGAVWTKWQWRGLLVLSLVIASFCAAASLSQIARGAGVLRDWNLAGDYSNGLTFDIPAGTPAGWWRVTHVAPGAAAASAGLRSGDLLRPEAAAWSSNAVLAPGVRLPGTVERDGKRFPVEIVVPEQPPLPGAARLNFGLRGFASLVSVGLGVLLLLSRGRRNRAAATLGMVLQCLGWVGAYGSVWAPAPIVLRIEPALSVLTVASLCYFLSLVGLAVSGGPRSPKEGRLVHAMAVLLAAIPVGLLLANRILAVGVPWLAGFVPWIVLAALLCIGCIVRNYWRNDPLARNRIKIVLLAFACYTVSLALFAWFIAAGTPPRLSWVINASAFAALVAPALIAYAMLRHRLFDFNFALNRSLVYGGVSFVLLAAFGIAKWVVEHLIPEAWHEGSEFYSFGIALALFLSLHRVHNWVENNVERVFFRRWHRNEADLRRFVAAAAHYEEAPALCRNFAGELSRFGQGAGSALYLREADGSYRLWAGDLAGAEAVRDADDHAFALMRAERGVVDLVRARSALPGALALPMLDQGKLAGFALLAAKPDGSAYRPDEIEVLGWAAHQVGLDLQAMNAHELEAKLADLGKLNASLTIENGRLTALLAKRTANAPV